MFATWEAMRIRRIVHCGVLHSILITLREHGRFIIIVGGDCMTAKENRFLSTMDLLVRIIH